MPLARHDTKKTQYKQMYVVSTHMPLARHDVTGKGHATDDLFLLTCLLRGMTKNRINHRANAGVSTHMPLARHDVND